jgi:hypothetical protein
MNFDSHTLESHKDQSLFIPSHHIHRSKMASKVKVAVAGATGETGISVMDGLLECGDKFVSHPTSSS